LAQGIFGARGVESETPIWKSLAGLGVFGHFSARDCRRARGGALDWNLVAEEAGRAALAEPRADAFAVPPLLSPEQQALLAEAAP